MKLMSHLIFGTTNEELVKEELDADKKTSTELTNEKSELESRVSSLRVSRAESQGSKTELTTRYAKEIELKRTKIAAEKKEFDLAMDNLRKASQATGLRVDLAVEFYHKAAFMSVAATDTAVQADSFARKVGAVREEFRLAAIKGKNSDVVAYLKTSGLEIFASTFAALGVTTVDDFGLLKRIQQWEEKFKAKAIELQAKQQAAARKADAASGADVVMREEDKEDEFPNELQMEKVRELVNKFDEASKKVKQARLAKKRTQTQYKEGMEKMLGLVQNFGKLSGPQVETGMKSIRDTRARDAGKSQELLK